MIEEIRTGRYEAPSRATAIDYIRWLVRHSHEGWISSPFSAPACLDPENLAHMHAGFAHLLTVLERSTTTAATA